VVWTVDCGLHKIKDMKAVVVGIIAALGLLAVMLAAGMLIHDQTLSEAWKGSPDQFWQSLDSLLMMAWQYKVVTMIVFGIVTAVLYVRRVPEIKNR